jgi:aryl-alcohol dehydrogenase-like predicted oxidoreductase
MIPGRATEEGTARYRSRFQSATAPDHFRQARGLWLSSIGLGTYLGEPTEEDDAAYEDAVRAALLAGSNVLDTAINYRFQRSERSVGAALRALVEEGGVARDEIVVATKGGFIPFDGGYPDDPSEYVRKTFLRPGIIKPSDIVADCHCLAPGYVDHQFEASRRNLGLETLDIYYLHNPETQLRTVGESELLSRLKAAFEVLEKKVLEGRLGIYGTATWDGYRLPPGQPGRLDLAGVLRAAADAARTFGSTGHHFGAVQLPLNLAMPEALARPTQTPAGPDGRPPEGHGEAPAPFLAAAAHARLVVMASASILQGHLPPKVTPDLAARIPGGETGAHKAIQFVRSAPGLATALVGMKSRRHVQENLRLAAFPRMTVSEMRALLGPGRPGAGVA